MVPEDVAHPNYSISSSFVLYDIFRIYDMINGLWRCTPSFTEYMECNMFIWLCGFLLLKIVQCAHHKLHEHM